MTQLEYGPGIYRCIPVVCLLFIGRINGQGLNQNILRSQSKLRVIGIVSSNLHRLLSLNPKWDFFVSEC